MADVSGNPHPHALPNRARGSSLLLFLLAFFAWPSFAGAIRAVPWAPGRPVVVNLRPSQTTEIVLPAPVGEYVNPEGQLFSILRMESRLMVKPLDSFRPTRLFAMDAKGRSYIIELHEAAEGEKEDDSVEIVPELAERPFAVVGRGRKDLIRALFIAMKLERPIGGFEISEKKGELFYDEPGVMKMREVRRYDSNVLRGYVVEVENISSGPLPVNPQRLQFRFKGFIAGSVTDMSLAPREPENSVEAFKGQPKKTLAYIVVSREGQ